MLIRNCEAQKTFIQSGINANIRVDGRKNHQKRQPTIKNGVLHHLLASSYLFIEYENVQIYAGVKLKIEKVDKLTETPPIKLEISSMKKLSAEESQEMLWMQSIIQNVYIKELGNSKSIKKMFKLEKAVQHQIVVYIDVFLLNRPHISLSELICNCIYSALQSTQIPNFNVSFNQVTEEELIQIEDTSSALKMDEEIGLSIVGVLNDDYVVDMREEEYESMDGCLLLILKEGKITYVETLKGKISIEKINKAVKFRLS